MQEDIKKIIDYGIFAPSGDNSQPWKFVLKEDSLFLFNIPDRDNPYYNFRQFGSYISHGAVIENMLIASKSMGYELNIELFPDQSLPDLVAKIIFSKSIQKNDPLFEYISKRCTNRKPYDSNYKLTSLEKEIILKSSQGIANSRIILIENKKNMSELGKAVSKNEVIALEMKKLHDIFFNDIVWSENEEKEKRFGLYIKTLELPLPIQKLFKLLKNWQFTNFMNKIGFSKFAAAGNAKIYSSGSAHGLVVMNNNSVEDYIYAGRIMQRIWLQASRMGLSIQPIAGIIFLMQRILANKAEEMSEVHIKLVKNSYQKIKEIAGINDGTIAMFFRIGRASEPTVRSSRMPANIV